MTGPRTEEQWRWAEALAFEKLCGENARLQLAERIGVVVLLGDDDGIKRLQKIATCLDQITKAPIHAS